MTRQQILTALLGLVTFAALGIVLVLTAPNRWGIGIALHYLSRLVWPDPSDPVPSLRPSDDRLESPP